MSRKALAAATAMMLVLVACSSSKKAATSTTVAGSATTAAAGGSATTAAANQSPVEVLAVLSTGGQGATGEQAKVALNGLKAAANVLNAQGGILGRQVKIEVLDDAGNPTNGAGLLQQRLQSTPKPDVVIPGSISTEGVAYVPITTSAGILSIGTPSALTLLDPSKYPYNFSMPPSQVAIALQMAQYAKDNGATKLAVISAQSAFGTSWATAVKQAVANVGLPASYETYVDMTQLDMTASLQRLKATGADYLLMQGFGASVGYVLDSKTKLGWNVPTLCESTCGVTPLVTSTLVGTPDEQNFKIQVPLIDSYSPNPTQGVTNYLNALKALGPITGINTQYSFEYDALMVVAQAAKQANSLATPALTKALENLQQPANPLWVTLAQYHWSSTSHAAQGSGKDYPMVVPTKLVNGQVGAPGA
jgi:branched-chain amino acid transport system substrate-binding protein